MDNKTILFSTGKLIINETNISFHQNQSNINNVNTIARENIGHMNKQSMRLLPRSVFNYVFIIAISGFATMIGGLIFATKPDIFLTLGTVLIITAGVLLGSFMLFDGLMGINIVESVLTIIFGVDAYRIVVQDVFGGNNFIFLISANEVSKVPKFEDYKLEKRHKIENADITHNNKNSYDDIEKLANLRDKGIISQTEFDQKKRQILGI